MKFNFIEQSRLSGKFSLSSYDSNHFSSYSGDKPAGSREGKWNVTAKTDELELIHHLHFVRHCKFGENHILRESITFSWFTMVNQLPLNLKLPVYYRSAVSNEENDSKLRPLAVVLLNYLKMKTQRIVFIEFKEWKQKKISLSDRKRV